MSTSASNRLHPLALLAILVLALFALDRAVAFVLSRAVLHSGNRVAQVYAGRAGADLLVTGNSVAGAMTTVPLIERETGLQAYTMAVHGLDARTQELFARAYLENNPPPRYVMMEIRSASDRDIIAREFTMFARESPGLIGLAEEQSPSAIPWRRVSAAYNFNSRNLPAVLRRVVEGDDQDESESNGHINAAKKHRFVERKLTVSIDPEQLAAFARTVRMFQDHGATVLVVAAPMHDVTRELGPWAERNIAIVRDALPPGTRFLDGLHLFDGDAAFEDPIHMNENGRRRFAPVLAQSLT